MRCKESGFCLFFWRIYFFRQLIWWNSNSKFSPAFCRSWNLWSVPLALFGLLGICFKHVYVQFEISSSGSLFYRYSATIFQLLWQPQIILLALQASKSVCCWVLTVPLTSSSVLLSNKKPRNQKTPPIVFPSSNCLLQSRF